MSGPDDHEEGPASPVVPSFASLRGPRRPSAIDLLVPGRPAEPPQPEPVPTPEPAAELPRETPPPSVPVPRPADYADLLRFGCRLVSAVAGLPLRLLRRAAR